MDQLIVHVRRDLPTSTGEHLEEAKGLQRIFRAKVCTCCFAYKGKNWLEKTLFFRVHKLGATCLLGNIFIY